MAPSILPCRIVRKRIFLNDLGYSLFLGFSHDGDYDTIMREVDVVEPLLSLKCINRDCKCGILHCLGILRAFIPLRSPVTLNSFAPGLGIAGAGLAHVALQVLYKDPNSPKFLTGFSIDDCCAGP